MFQNGNVKGLEVQQNAEEKKEREKTRCIAETARIVLPWAEDGFFSQTTFFPKQQSICYALSRHKVYKLAGKFINLLECLAFSCNKATQREVFMVMVSLRGGGWKSRGGGGGLEVSGEGGWKSRGREAGSLEGGREGGREGGGSAVRCDSTKHCQRLLTPPPPLPYPLSRPRDFSTSPRCCQVLPCCSETVTPLT